MTTLSEYESMAYASAIEVIDKIQCHLSVVNAGVITNEMAIAKISAAMEEYKQHEQVQMEMFKS
jgi:hypothetical protein